MKSLYEGLTTQHTVSAGSPHWVLSPNISGTQHADMPALSCTQKRLRDVLGDHFPLMKTF